MSYYTNLLKELPRRNLELLNRYFKKEKKEIEPYEVTLLISLAMPVFVISTEIIKKNDGKDHKDLFSRLNKNIKDNPIFNNLLDDWFYEFTDRSYDDIDSLKFHTSFSSSQEINSLSTLTQIRNALSHGIIKFIKGDKNEISKILFISEKRINAPRNGLKKSVSKQTIVEGHHLNLVSVECFKAFLINWCQFLQKEKAEYCLTVLQDAA